MKRLDILSKISSVAFAFVTGYVLVVGAQAVPRCGGHLLPVGQCSGYCPADGALGTGGSGIILGRKCVYDAGFVDPIGPFPHGCICAGVLINEETGEPLTEFTNPK